MSPSRPAYSAPPPEDVRIYELKRTDLEGSVVIDGFPSVGLVSSIVANYLIDTLNMEQIGIVDSPSFPTVSLVRDGEPQNPVRIYAGFTPTRRSGLIPEKLVAFVSEFQPAPSVVKPLAQVIMDWIQEQRCSLLVSPEGLVVENEGEEGHGATPPLANVRVYGVASTKKARDLYIEPNVIPFQEGVVTGVAGVFLNEGRRRGFDVLTFLAEAHPDYPDARAAAKVIETIDRILLRTTIDPVPLYHEAERIEQQLLAIRRSAQDRAERDRGQRPPSMPMYG
jgi:uncharacterized protein